MWILTVINLGELNDSNQAEVFSNEHQIQFTKIVFGIKRRSKGTSQSNLIQGFILIACNFIAKLNREG